MADGAMRRGVLRVRIENSIDFGIRLGPFPLNELGEGLKGGLIHSLIWYDLE